MNTKRGQVTIFLIIGVVILFTAAGLYFFLSKTRVSSLEVEGEKAIRPSALTASVQGYVEDCLKEVALPGIYLLSASGGMIYIDDDSKLLLTDFGQINYGWVNEQYGFSKQKMERDLAIFTEKNLNYCLDNFSVYEEQNISIEPDFSNIAAKYTVRDHDLLINLELPLVLREPDEKARELNTFSARIRSNYGEMINSAKEIINNFEDKFDPEKLEGGNYYPVVFPYNDKITIFSLTDNDELVDTEGLILMFAVRKEEIENQPPLLDFIPDLTLRVNDRLEKTLTAEDPNNDPLTFFSDSSAFPVDKEGLLDLTVLEPGQFKVVFGVKDQEGLESEQKVKITVLENDER